jgi:hypothetical protein
MLKSNVWQESNEQMKTFAALKPNDKELRNSKSNYLAGLMGIKIFTTKYQSIRKV